MIVKPTVAVIGALLVAGVATPAAGQQWQVAKCDLSTKHYLVNSGVLYLRSATETKFADKRTRSEEHTSELQSRSDLVCRLLLEKKKKNTEYKNHVDHARQSQHGIEQQTM